MTDKLRECPNCGAYVLSEDRHCPRCDTLLDEDSPQLLAVDRAPDPDVPPEPSAAQPGDGAPMADVREADVPTTRLPWAKPAFPPEPDEPDAGDDREAAPPDEPEDAFLPDLLDATRAHTAPTEAEPAEAVEDAAPQDDLTDLAVPEFPDATRANLPPPPPDVPDALAESPAAGEPPDEAAAVEPDAPAPVEAGDDAALEAGAAAPEGDTNALETEEPGGPEDDFAAEKTMPRLTDDLVHPADEMDGADLDDSEMPTSQFRQSTEEPDVPDESTMVRQRGELVPPPVIVPPAPYTPPPGPIPPPPVPAYAPDPGIAYLQQRVQAYVYGGYRLHVHAPHEATLSQGKQLGVGGWMLALVSVIGFLWYLLIVVLGGFRPDMAYLVLETDGRVYEDGPGAAHIRHQRARAGRRWSIFGLVILFLGLGLAVALVAVAGIVLTQERYQAALREAYPAVTLFEERFSDAQADPDDVRVAETGAVIYAVLAGLAVLGLWGGATLFVIGTVHAGAYRVRVPPLPGYA